MWDLLADILKAIGKWIGNRRLSRDEKAMLARALPDGEIYILESAQTGKFIRVASSTHDYFDQADPAVQEKGLHTLNTLLTKGLVRDDEGTLYRLTSAGFERARRIAKKMKVGASPQQRS